MSDTIENRQFRLKRRPSGMPERDDFELTREALREAGEDREVRVAIDYISLDPAMRGWMSAGKSYIEPVGLGEVMRAGAAGTVIDSKHPDFAAGDKVSGNLGVQTHAVFPGDELRKVDTSLADLPVYLGPLGMPGMTAYFGTLYVGALTEGDVVLVSAASGAVGALVGQIAKKKGASKVVGIAGGPDKCAYVVDKLGFDAVIDYKAEEINDAIRRECPDGLDVYFDNVGGEMLDAALANLRWQARVVICGAISQYNVTGHVGDTAHAPKNYLSLLINRARMEGFIVFDFADHYPEAAREMAGWIADGDLVHREDIVEGFEDFPETFLKLFTGDNFGKLVLAVER